MLFTVVKFTHLISLLLLFSASLAKNLLLLARPVNESAISKCRTADRVSGVAAVFIVVSGAGLIYLSPKGMDFYTANSSLWIKVAVLILASALIVKTKVYFRVAAKSLVPALIDVPAVIPSILKFDLGSLVVMTYLGVLVAYGTGIRI
jgi:uncharacterized membrane protein